MSIFSRLSEVRYTILRTGDLQKTADAALLPALIVEFDHLEAGPFARPESVARGALRPLRQPGDPNEGEC